MRLALVISCLCAALAPLLAPASDATQQVLDLPEWPTEFEGVALVPLPLTEREGGFLESFPGRIARFRCGPRELVLRFVAQPTRMLHPAADCFRGAGYAITPLPLVEDSRGRRWSHFEATRGSERLIISERISDSDGREWIDTSAWYWTASVGETRGPWLATTVARRHE